MLFSQRKGIKPVRSIMQVDSMDDGLRNGLWNNLSTFYWDTISSNSGNLSSPYNRSLKNLMDSLWHNFFKWPLDTMHDWWPDNRGAIRRYFFAAEWYEVYDFIEFIANEYVSGNVNDNFIVSCNNIFKRELSGYRFIGGKITQITSEEEIIAIEEALSKSAPLKPVYTHLKTALDLLSDKKSPDYRNSIKESISAVEAISRIITGKPKATLGQALKIIKDKKVELHPALEKTFESMYGYTNDEDGIRHSLLDESNLKFIDAKFMLVSCASFINYLIEKVSEAGITLSQ